jgi:ABC-2 type transport system ATP-binding protein
VFLTTAYLDEAERCNRVGLMYKGRLIREDTPQAVRSQMEEGCYALTSGNLREARSILLAQPGVLSAESSARALHVFLSGNDSRAAELVQVLEANGQSNVAMQKVTPSLEDVFIALVRKAERTEMGAATEATQ